MTPDPSNSPEALEVLACDSLRTIDVAGLNDWPVARSRDPEFGAILWLSRARPIEQTVEVLARRDDGSYEIGDSFLASSDWSPPDGDRSTALWFSGFEVQVPSVSDTHGVFVTGILADKSDTVFLSEAETRLVPPTDRRDRQFIVRLPMRR